MVDQALAQLSPTFDRMYASNGRASIPPEHLRKACLLMALFSVRSERQFCERREYDRLFKWFLDLNIVDRSFDHSVLFERAYGGGDLHFLVIITDEEAPGEPQYSGSTATVTIPPRRGELQGTRLGLDP